MHRAPLSRLLSSLFALWFALVLGDPGVLHACPEHGSHSMHGSMSHASHQMGSQQHTPVKGGDCTCMGCCAAAPHAAPLAELSTFSVSTRIVAPLSLPTHDSGVRAVVPDRLLPFANGPPQA